jgi:hypothetical protein
MQKLLQNMRFALRQMARGHGFSLTAICRWRCGSVPRFRP